MPENNHKLGTICSKYESRGSVSAISSGKGDKGGQSYGSYQLASKQQKKGQMSSMERFLRSEGKKYTTSEYNQLDIDKIGTKEFNKNYKNLCELDAKSMADAQHKFIQRTHYEPLLNKVKKLGYNTDNVAIKEAIWSMSVQHGGAIKIFEKVHNQNKFGEMSRSQRIDELYKEREEYATKYTDKSLHNGIKNRYSNESKDLKELCDHHNPDEQMEADYDFSSFFKNGGEHHNGQNLQDLVGGVELSLNHINLDNLYGFTFDNINKTMIALLCNNEVGDDEKESNKNDQFELSDTDSILKKTDNKNSVMIWQHFCIFLKMFHDVGDRESVSFSLDPDGRIDKHKSNGNVIMKKVYYPEHLRWSKAGEVMFDADLFIKTLLYDLHPDITKHIPNYQSYIQKTLDNINWDDKSKNDDNSNWHRLWIVLDEIEQTEDDKSVIINKIKFKINARKMNVNDNGELHDDLNGNEDELLTQFVDHMNKNMDIIHKHSLFLQRLEGVFRALILAKFAYNNNIPFNMDIIDEICNKQKDELNSYGITFTLPSLVKNVSKHREINNGDHIIQESRTHKFSGGIKLNMTIKDNKSNDFEVKQKLKSLNKAFQTVQQKIKSMKQEFEKKRLTFEKLCNFRNKNEEYTAILFPNILFDKKHEKLCEHDECKEVISWQKLHVFENKNYCEDHYNKNRYSMCTKCNGKIDRLNDKYRIIKSDNKQLMLHSTCCVCFYCDKVLNENICVDTKNGFGLYCNNTCFRKAAGFTDNNSIKKCIKCQQDINILIEVNIVQTANGDVLHGDCLKCDECHKSLKGGQKTIIDDKNNIFCGQTCANKQMMKALNNNNKKQITCNKCAKRIDLMSAEGYIKMDDNTFIHPSCLKCDECNQIITNGNTMMDNKNNMFCSKICANKQAMKRMNKNNNNNKSMSCHKCKNDIMLKEGVITIGNGILLHPKCATCYQCNKSLTTLTTGIVMDSDKNMFCSSNCGNHYHQNQ